MSTKKFYSIYRYSIKLERPFQKSQYSFLYIYPFNTCEKEYYWIVDAIKWHCNAIKFVFFIITNLYYY